MSSRSDNSAVWPEGRIPPYNQEAEYAVLGSALLNPQCMAIIRSTASEQDFYVEAHRRIFSAMCEVVDNGEPLDHVSLGSRLKKNGDLDKVGGAVALGGLTDSVVTVANVDHYIEIVRKAADVRRVIYTAQEIVSDGFSEDSEPDEYIMDARSKMTAAASQSVGCEEGGQLIGDGFQELFKRLEDGEPTVEFLQFGFGGCRVRKGVPTVVGSRPSNGKSTFAQNAAKNMSRQGLKGIIFSLEDTKRTVVTRIASSTSGVELSKMENDRMTIDDWRAFTGAANKVMGLPLWIYDKVGIDSDWIMHKSAFHKEKDGLDYIIVDYFQLMKIKGESRVDGFSNAVTGLTQIARELNIAVIIVSQIKRVGLTPGQIPKPPTEEDLKETGSLEQAAKTIFLIHYPAHYDKDGTNPDSESGKVRVETAKQSNGPCGVRWLTFTPEISWMGDVISQYEKDRGTGEY